jgi:hypothetical protein
MTNREYHIENEEKETDTNKVTAASMEGKLKEKLESTGIAFLCVSIAKFNENSILNFCKLISNFFDDH